MNDGLLDGLVTTGPQTFTPVGSPIQAFKTGGSPTQPTMGASILRAMYSLDGDGFCTYQGEIQFGTGFVPGAAVGGVVNTAFDDEVWGFRLPVPALRSLGGADLPIGRGWASGGTVNNRNQGTRITLMDPLAPDGLFGNEDYYCQMFIQNLLSSGTSGETNSPAFGSGATSVTITHGLGHTPNPLDIHVTWTNKPSTAPADWWVDTVTSTTFKLNLGASSTTTRATYAWKINALPNASANFDLLLNSARPFGILSGNTYAWLPGMIIGWDVTYQVRR